MGDVWDHARSALIQAVSDQTLNSFMSGFNSIVMRAFRAQAADGFYFERGVQVVSLELTRYEPVDQKTAETLEAIIQETTNRINRLQAQESENEVRAAKLLSDISLEKQRTEFIQTQAQNEQLRAEMEGRAGGLKRATGAAAFLDGLNASLPNVSSRVGLYTLHEELTANVARTQHLSSGSAQLFLTPEDVKLKLNLGEHGGAEL